MAYSISAGVAILSFAVTNIDDLLILTVFFANSAYRPRDIIVGQYLGIAALTICSFFLSKIADSALPPGSIKWMGLVPLFLGLKAFLAFIRDRGNASQEERSTPPQSLSRSKVLAVAAVTIANGGDNIGAYVPLFCSVHLPQSLFFMGIFFLMTALWCFIGYSIAHHQRLKHSIRYWGQIALPIVLVSLGIAILLGN